MPRHNGKEKSVSFTTPLFSLYDSPFVGSANNEHKSRSSTPLNNDSLNLLEFTNSINDELIGTDNLKLTNDTIMSDPSLSSEDNNVNNNDSTNENSYSDNTHSLLSEPIHDDNTILSQKYLSPSLSLKHINDDTMSFDDLISTREDSVSQSDPLSQDNYNHLISSTDGFSSATSKTKENKQL